MLFNTSECGAEIPQRLAITRSNLTRLFPPAVTHTSMLLLLLSDGLPLDCISNQLMHFYLFLFFFSSYFSCPLPFVADAAAVFLFFLSVFFFFFKQTVRSMYRNSNDPTEIRPGRYSTSVVSVLPHFIR